MKCPRCLNEDRRYFYKGSKGWYCRKCISFKRVLIKEEIEVQDYAISDVEVKIELKYELTPHQKKIAKEAIETIVSSDILLLCCTGAGKTEISMPIIATYLKKGKRVCYAIARREVVLELYERFRSTFINNTVTRVCGGYTNQLYADLIVCTTHQLYRYHHTFDLLILDEVDAFPFKGNDTLNNIALTSLTSDGRIVYSTATIDDHIQKIMRKRPLKTLSLQRRPHERPLIVPKVKIRPKAILYLELLRILKKTDRQTIIFTESIRICKFLYRILKRMFLVTYVYSSLEERSANIKAFKEKKFRFIVATSVLERGITIEGVDVIIIKFYDGIFDKASIVQMCGRVGRSFKDPYGNSYILTTNKDEAIRQAIAEMRKANEVYLL